MQKAKYMSSWRVVTPRSSCYTRLAFKANIKSVSNQKKALTWLQNMLCQPRWLVTFQRKTSSMYNWRAMKTNWGCQRLKKKKTVTTGTCDIKYETKSLVRLQQFSAKDSSQDIKKMIRAHMFKKIQICHTTHLQTTEIQLTHEL